MKIFIIGATGYVSTAIARDLLAHGHEVVGLARDRDKARQLAAAGIEPLTGDTVDLKHLGDLVAGADATIFSATVPFDQESNVIAPLLDRLAGSQKPFIFTSGTAVLSIDTPDGGWREESFAEDDPWTPVDRMLVRVHTETFVRDAASRGVRAMVIRPPLIWGHGGSKQVPALFDSVAATGSACFVGHGLNCYSNVHVDDLATVYRLAIERGAPGALYHAVSGEVSFRSIAEAVALVMGCSTRSIPIEQVAEIWNPQIGLMYFGVSSRSRAPRTRAELGWSPHRFDLIEEIRGGSYNDRYAPKDGGQERAA